LALPVASKLAYFKMMAIQGIVHPFISHPQKYSELRKNILVQYFYEIHGHGALI
jgi:tyrosine-protein phosphatase YwqE